MQRAIADDRKDAEDTGPGKGKVGRVGNQRSRAMLGAIAKGIGISLFIYSLHPDFLP
jgi:hypothetical protein